MAATAKATVRGNTKSPAEAIPRASNYVRHGRGVKHLFRLRENADEGQYGPKADDLRHGTGQRQAEHPQELIPAAMTDVPKKMNQRGWQSGRGSSGFHHDGFIYRCTW